MKESKNFFAKNNRLNKGYSRSFNAREFDNNFYRKKFEHILPPIDLVTEYENIYPGTLEKLIEMAKKEQIHRHDLELKNVKTCEQNAKISKICALIFAVCLLLGIIFLTIIKGILASTVLLICFIWLLLVFLRRTEFFKNSKKNTKENEYIKNKVH